MKPIKILFCIDNLVRGGTELQLIGLIDRLDRSRYEPYLLTLRPSDPILTPANCVHLALDLPKLISFDGVKKLIQLIGFLRREKISIVQTFFQDSTLFAGTAAWVARVPARIASCRDLAFWSNSKEAFMMRRVYSLMTAFICNANMVKDHFVQHFGIDPNRAQVLRNGVDVASLPFVKHACDAQHIGIVGNMTRHVKRTDLFIKAAGIVAQQYPNISWHIIGEGHLRAELETLAKERKVFDKIIFAGRITDVAAYLEKLDIAVICSDSEGLSNALIEYMFKGSAAVATRVGGNPELINDGVSGLLVPPDNEQALAAALIRLIADNALRESIAQQARTQVEREYSWTLCLKAHDDLYASQLTKN
jgi:glycosyltransferase involved in cell wall biosynthesis